MFKLVVITHFYAEDEMYLFFPPICLLSSLVASSIARKAYPEKQIA